MFHRTCRRDVVTAVAMVASALATPAFANDGSASGWSATIERASERAIAAGKTNTQVPGPDALYADAQMYMGLREWSVAERLLRAVISRYPDSASARYARDDIARLRRTVFGMTTRSTLGGPVTPSTAPSTRPIQPKGAPWNILGQRASVQDQFRGAVGDRLFFAAFSSALGTRNRETLREQATWLAARPDTRITLEAHSDEPGEGVDAIAVARSRADSVKAAFVRLGIAPERIGIVVYGRAKRVALCDSPVCRAQNRRVVVQVTDAVPAAPTAIR